MRTTIITLGTRGDLQPFVGLGLRMQQSGYDVRLATHTRFHGFVRSYGLKAAEIYDWGPADEQQQPRSAVYERFMQDSWRACRDAELVVSWLHYVWIPHIAEKLQVPCFLAHVSPLTPTGEFPNLALLNRVSLGRTLNRLTYQLAGKLFLRYGVRLTRRFREETLGLPPLANPRPLAEFYDRVRVLYAISPSVIPKPRDWPAWHDVTGFWFLDSPSEWNPPRDLLEFLDAGPPPVCVGFGQVADKNPKFTLPLVRDALARSGQRAIFVTRRVTGDDDSGDNKLPKDCYRIDAIPHDWLFPRTSAVITHGGAGTMAAALRAGVPTITIPYGGDQPFWARRVFKLGAATRPLSGARLTANALAAAIDTAVGDREMRDRAAALGRRIRSEDGTARAIEIIEENLPRAASAAPRGVAG